MACVGVGNEDKRLTIGEPALKLGSIAGGNVMRLVEA